MKNYDRDVIIKKLLRRGLKVKYCQGSHTISYFEAPHHIDVGIKCLGYLDFLKSDVFKKQAKKRKEQKEKQLNIIPEKAWSFNWFNTREDAENWAREQKENKWLDMVISKSTVYQTDNMDYRACLEGVAR